MHISKYREKYCQEPNVNKMFTIAYPTAATSLCYAPGMKQETPFNVTNSH